jgi:hypothetical protein
MERAHRTSTDTTKGRPVTLFDIPAEPPDFHPAKWSPEILAVIAPVIRARRLPVHDPFAGTGDRLGQLCAQLGLTFTGTEIEPEFARDSRVRAGDSTDPATYPQHEYVIVTSPAYPNGMSDHFKASNVTGRHTYRQALTQTIGYDRPLHPNNMGRYGIRYGQHALDRHYDIARQCVQHWPDHVIVNVSDFIMRRTERVHVVDQWISILETAGYTITEVIPITTPRQRHGANADARVDHEAVLIATR